MPGQDYEATAQKLVDNGLAIDTPCAIVSQATSPEQCVHVTTIERLAACPKLPTPNLLIVGAVAALADHKSLPQDQDFFTQEYPYEGIEEQAKWQSK
jgi:uroporphyrin-III C-methyltransferase